MRKTLGRAFLVHPDRHSWLPALLWWTVAIASLSAAVGVALQPGRLQDLYQVRTWLAYAQQHSADPYLHFSGELDYPPIAFLVLWPLGWIPDAALVAWFLPLSILIAAAAAWIFVGAIAERLYMGLTTPQQVAIVAIMLASGSVRGAIWRGQTVALAVLFGALALRWSRRRPFAAGIMLALCSFKPHLAVGFGLAILLVEGLDVVVIGLAVTMSASLLVAAAFNQSLLTILASYARNLFSMYDGPARVHGKLSVRWMFEDLLGNYGLSTLLYGALAYVSLMLIAAAARRARSAAGRAQVIAAALLWPLLFLPSQLYNGLMAAPAIWLLMWSEAALIVRESRRLVVVAAFVLFGVLDLPRALRLLSDQLDDGRWLFESSYYLSPLRIVLLFGFILVVAFRRTSAKDPGHPT